MIIPDKVKIGAHNFAVHFVSELDGFTRMGELQHWKGRINLQMEMIQSKRESIFLHECFHEMSYQHNWGLEEDKVTSIAETFYQFLIDNELLK